MTRRIAIAATALMLLAAAPAGAQQILEPNGAPLTLDQAHRIVAAAESEARKQNFKMAFAVLEPSGALVMFARMDGVQYGSIEVAQAKGRSAALFRRATKVFADGVAGGANGTLSLPGAVAIEGGVPIVMGGKMVGALGVSGGTAVQDGQIAAAALAATAR